MNKLIIIILILIIGCFGGNFFGNFSVSANPSDVSPADNSTLSITRRISQEILSQGRPFINLQELVALGHRLTGSSGAEKAIQWAKAKMVSYGLDRVELQPVQVPHWVRGGREVARIRGQVEELPLQVTALGGSVGTGQAGVEAPVIEVQSLKEVETLGAAIQGKIVFYNRPMDISVDSFEAYDAAVDQRIDGASQAARYGAKAVLVRSLTTLAADDNPHTGVLTYERGVAQIPAAAISTHGAQLLSQSLKKDPALKVKLELSAKRLPDVRSYNVIGELTGKELPNETVVVGGHLDSWDLGVGAQDDGCGVVQSLEVLRIFKSLGLKPRRTVRVALFMVEEWGGRGGKEYARQAKRKGEKHLAAIESDQGGFEPVGFTVQNSSQALRQIQYWEKYLAPLKATQFTQGSGGTDIEPLAEATGAVAFGFVPQSKHYFDFHHSALDQLSAVNAEELHQGAAAMAVLTYLLAEKGL